MKPQPLVRRQAALTRFGIVTIHLAQHLQHMAAFVREVLCHIHELPSSMRGIQSSGYGPLSGERIYLQSSCEAIGKRAFCASRSEEHTSELQSLRHLVCRLLLEKKRTI